MNDWKKILDQMANEEYNGERQFHTTEIKVQARRKKKILGVSPTLFFICILVFLLVICLGIFVFTMVKDRVDSYDRIYPGVSALGVDLGGLTQEEAEDALREYSNNYFSGRVLVVRCMDKTLEIKVRDIMTDIDAAAISKKAYEYGRSESMFQRYSMLKSEEPHVLSVVGLNGYDREKVNEMLNTLADSVEQEYKNYSYILNDSGLTIFRGQDGISLNRAALCDEVNRRLSDGEYGEYTVEPTITTAEIPDWNILRETFRVVAVDASIAKAGSRGFSIENEVIGKDVDINRIEADMLRDDWTEQTYPFIYTTPQITAEILSSMLFRDVLSRVESDYNSYETKRTTNLSLATEKINEIILMPGEEFSFNKVVGERTEARGFQTAIVFAGGEMVDGVGGGICQVSSTIYLATLLADLEVTERHPHAFTVSYLPLAQDATVQWGYLDYKFVNSSDYPIKISAVMTGNKLVITLYGTKTDPDKHVEVETVTTNTYPFETETVLNTSLPKGNFRQTQSGKNGYQCELYQLIYDGDNLVERRLANKSYYKRQNQIIEQNP